MIVFNLVRFHTAPHFTIGVWMFNDGSTCFTVEPPTRQITDDTTKPVAIEAGTHDIVMVQSKTSGMLTPAIYDAIDDKYYEIQVANSYKNLAWSMSVCDEVHMQTGDMKWSSDAWLMLMTALRNAGKAQVKIAYAKP